MYEIFAMLLDKNGVRAADVCKGTGLPSSFFSEWKRGKSNPKTDKLQKIADFFGVSLEYLLTGKEETKDVENTNERDIAKRLEDTLKELENSPDILLFSDKPLDDKTRELLKASLENCLRIAKINAGQD